MINNFEQKGISSITDCDLRLRYEDILQKRNTFGEGYLYLIDNNNDIIVSEKYTDNIFKEIQYYKQHSKKSFSNYAIFDKPVFDKDTILKKMKPVSWDLTGIYYLFIKNDLVYIGSTINLFDRLYSRGSYDFYYFEEIKESYIDITEIEAEEIVAFGKYFDLENRLLPTNSRYKSSSGIANELLGKKTSFYKSKVEETITKNNIAIAWIGKRKSQKIFYYDFEDYYEVFSNDLLHI